MSKGSKRRPIDKRHSSKTNFDKEWDRIFNVKAKEFRKNTAKIMRIPLSMFQIT